MQQSQSIFFYLTYVFMEHLLFTAISPSYHNILEKQELLFD